MKKGFNDLKTNGLFVRPKGSRLSGYSRKCKEKSVIRSV